MKSLSLKNIELLESIYANKSIKNLDSKNHNRNIKVLRDSMFLLKDNTLSKLGLQAIGKVKIEKTVVKTVVNNVDILALFAKFLTDNNINANNAIIATKNTGLHEVKVVKVVKPLVNDTVELIDKKKRVIDIDKAIFSKFTSLLAGKHFTSYESASNLSLKFAIDNKLVKVTKKDGKNIIKNINNASTLPYTHFLNSYIYKNGYIV